MMGSPSAGSSKAVLPPVPRRLRRRSSSVVADDASNLVARPAPVAEWEDRREISRGRKMERDHRHHGSSRGVAGRCPIQTRPPQSGDSVGAVEGGRTTRWLPK